jgi:hypothetical protein
METRVWANLMRSAACCLMYVSVLPSSSMITPVNCTEGSSGLKRVALTHLSKMGREVEFCSREDMCDCRSVPRGIGTEGAGGEEG